MEVLQGQIFTPNKKTILADEIKIELENLNKAIAKGGIDAGQKQAIDSSKLALQKVLTSILTKKGVVTPDETDDALKKIDEAKYENQSIINWREVSKLSEKDPELLDFYKLCQQTSLTNPL